MPFVVHLNFYCVLNGKRKKGKENREAEHATYDTACLVAVFSVVAIMAFSRWRIVASVADRTGNTMFRLQILSG